MHLAERWIVQFLERMFVDVYVILAWEEEDEHA